MPFWEQICGFARPIARQHVESSFCGIVRILLYLVAHEQRAYGAAASMRLEFDLKSSAGIEPCAAYDTRISTTKPEFGKILREPNAFVSLDVCHFGASSFRFSLRTSEIVNNVNAECDKAIACAHPINAACGAGLTVRNVG